MKSVLTLVCLIIVSNLSLNAQDVNGRIVDSSKTPIQHVIAYTGSNHSHTDELGKFKLTSLSIGDTINIEFLGFKDVEHVVTAKDFDNELYVVMTPGLFELSEVTISKSVKSTNTISNIDINVSPVNSSQEVLRRVPGLLIGQHAGGGKAEQIFLRGFDVDHGTDIALNVDGIPINMVSHAHGQGYSDLHFIIPETIENIDFGKGPYYTDIGNFNTAGYVNFKTKDAIDQSSIGLDVGMFDTARFVGLFNLLDGNDNQSAYIATEYQQSDGPVESPQNFNRLNLMGKYRIKTQDGGLLSLVVSRLTSKWDASGQIPQRLVDNGTITRFGSVDDTEGGNTSRTNIGINHTKTLSDDLFIKTNAFYSQYDFELFSNFTFFLEDPINGDQIRQYETRNIYGLNTSLFKSIELDKADLELSTHVGFRYDDVNDVELSNTLNRKTPLSTLSLGDVDETNAYAGLDASLDINSWLINAGVRVDYFNFNYVNRLTQLYDNQSVDKVRVSPKLNIIYNQSNQWQYYFKSGIGFHSNDSRVVIDGSADVVLPAAYGADLGFIYKPIPNLVINTALWYLFLDQEFVYVGDAGIVEPSGRTRRQGLDLSIRYQLGRYLFLNADLTYTDATAVDEAEGEDNIPLAVNLMSTGGLTFRGMNGFSGGIRYRYITDRPANEDGSITALGYFITDLNVNYEFKKLMFGLAVENLFDTEWNEAQFATESRLRNEAVSVEELHFTPGVPFFLKGSVRYKF